MLSHIILIVLLLSVLILRFLLDIRLAQKFICIVGYIDFRFITRENPINLSGDWEIIWKSGGSKAFEKIEDRHGHIRLYQAWSYVYGEFFSKGVKYAIFGKLHEGYLTGDWYDLKNKSGYFGVFHCECIQNKTMDGQWLGHSITNKIVRSDEIQFKRVGV